MNQRFVLITATIALIFISGITFLYSKIMKTNLEVSQKYEEKDYTNEIERMELLYEISTLFLLILTLIFIGIISTTRINNKN